MINKLIIFDLDGVLVNSLNNMQIALKLTSKKLKLNIDFKKYKKFLGLPFNKIMEKIGIKKNADLIKKNYFFFSQKNIHKIAITKKKINDLKILKKNYFLTIFTSKDKLRTNKITKKYKLFDYVITCDDVKKGKPSPEGVLRILKKFKINKENCVYVGDSYYDYKCSKDSGVKYLHANWGYDKLKLLKKINRINNLIEIKKYI